MAIAGRVAIVPKGDWSADATYKRLDAVTHNNTLYFAKKNVPAGTVTSNTEYWSRSIVGSAVIVDDTMSDTSENPVQNKVIKKYADDTFRKKKIAELAGDGKTQYFKLCTLKIIAHYADTPFEITVRARGREMLDRLCVLFKSVNTLDPDLSSFRVFGESGAWYITKIATSTWAIYGIKSEPRASVQVVDYTAYNNVTITWDMTGVASLPSSKTQASWGGKVRYADVAGNVVNNQTTTVDGFALDARQANPNIDGTLAKQVADLNDSYIALNKADDGTLNGWMVGYSIYGAGFVIPIPSINNPRLSNKKVKIFTTSGWQECTSQPQMVTGFGSGYNVFYNDGLPKGLEHGKAFLCQFI